jgi:hypothetical protein
VLAQMAATYPKVRAIRPLASLWHTSHDDLTRDLTLSARCGPERGDWRFMGAIEDYRRILRRAIEGRPLVLTGGAVTAPAHIVRKDR